MRFIKDWVKNLQTICCCILEVNLKWNRSLILVVCWKTRAAKKDKESKQSSIIRVAILGAVRHNNDFCSVILSVA